MEAYRKEKTKAFHPISELPNFLCPAVHPTNNALPGQGITQHFLPEFVTLYEALIHIMFKGVKGAVPQTNNDVLAQKQHQILQAYVVMDKVAHLTPPKNESAHLHISTGLHKMGTELMSTSPKTQARRDEINSSITTRN